MKKTSVLTQSQRHWLEVLRDCEYSGQASKAYAEKRGIAVSSLYKWRKQLVQQGVWPGQDPPIRLDRIEPSGSPAPSNGCRIDLPNGIQIQVTGVIDEPSLSAVLTAAMRL